MGFLRPHEIDIMSSVAFSPCVLALRSSTVYCSAQVLNFLMPQTPKFDDLIMRDPF